MLGHKGKSSGKFGQKAIPYPLIGRLNKSHEMGEKKMMKEIVAQAPKYGSLEKK